MSAAKNFGVALYFVAAAGSISLSLLLSATPLAATYAFPQPGSQDAVVAWVRSIYP